MKEENNYLPKYTEFPHAILKTLLEGEYKEEWKQHFIISEIIQKQNGDFIIKWSPDFAKLNTQPNDRM